MPVVLRALYFSSPCNLLYSSHALMHMSFVRKHQHQNVLAFQYDSSYEYPATHTRFSASPTITSCSLLHRAPRWKTEEKKMKKKKKRYTARVCENLMSVTCKTVTGPVAPPAMPYNPRLSVCLKHAYTNRTLLPPSKTAPAQYARVFLRNSNILFTRATAGPLHQSRVLMFCANHLPEAAFMFNAYKKNMPPIIVAWSNIV